MLQIKLADTPMDQNVNLIQNECVCVCVLSNSVTGIVKFEIIE